MDCSGTRKRCDFKTVTTSTFSPMTIWTGSHETGTSTLSAHGGQWSTSRVVMYLTVTDEPFLLDATGKKVKQRIPCRLDSSVEWEPFRDVM
ncbi:hypothetical protein V2J09_008817 [Rumex salicifolius]